MTLHMLAIIIAIALLPILFWVFSAFYTVFHYFSQSIDFWRRLVELLDQRRDAAENLINEIKGHFYYDPEIIETADAMHFVYAPAPPEKRCARQELEKAYLAGRALELIENYPVSLYDYWLPEIEKCFFDLDNQIDSLVNRYNFSAARFNSYRHGFFTSSVSSLFYTGELPQIRIALTPDQGIARTAPPGREASWRPGGECSLCCLPSCSRCAHPISALSPETPKLRIG